MIAIVIESFKSDVVNPIIMQKADELIVGREYKGDAEWKNWRLCTHIASSREGWVPAQFIEHTNGKDYAGADYNATELSLTKGDELGILCELNGWYLAKDLLTGKQGWIPVRCCRILKSESVPS